MGGATSLPFPLAIPFINTGAGAEVLATGLSEAGAILFLARAGLCFVGSQDLLTSAGFEDSLSLKMMRGAALRDLLSCTWGCARQFLLSLQHILSLTQGTQAVMPLPDPLLPACSKHSFPPLKHLQHGGSWSWQIGTGCLSCRTTGRFTSTLLSSTSSSSLSSSASTSITASMTILPFPLSSQHLDGPATGSIGDASAFAGWACCALGTLILASVLFFVNAGDGQSWWAPESLGAGAGLVVAGNLASGSFVASAGCVAVRGTRASIASFSTIYSMGVSACSH